GIASGAFFASTSGVLALGFNRLLRCRSILALSASDRLTLLAPFARIDLDLLRLHRFGDLAHQVDCEQSVTNVRTLDLDMVGKREAALERARGDAAIDIVGALVFGLIALAAGHDQHILLSRDVEFA